MKGKTIRRGLAALLCMAMLLSLPALAVFEEDEIQEIPVVSETDVVAELPEVPVEAPFDDGSLGEQAEPMASTVFSVTVPTTVAIHMDASGGITCGDIVITNNSTDAVLIKDTQVSALNGWTLVDYATTTFTDADRGQHRMALQFARGNGITAAGVNTGEDIIPSGGGRQTVSVAAKIPYQGVPLTNATIAQVVFVLGWHKVVIPMTGLTITGDDSVDVGSALQLSATKSPANTTDTGTISWSSSDTSVATVNSDGIVTGKSDGTAVITASCGSIVATKDVVVRDFTLVTNIEFQDAWGKCLPESGPLEFREYGYTSYSAHVIPESALDRESVSISSSNRDVAYQDGPSSIYITGQPGTVTITVSCGSFSKTLEFEVGHWR